MGASGEVIEVFSSIQGEGPYVGRRHLFIRLAGCSFGCSYCDQPEARAPSPTARFQRAPDSDSFDRYDNPVSAEEVVRRALALDVPAGLHHAFSITGGEPLEQPAFLAELLKGLAAGQPAVMLETNGLMTEALARVIDLVDIVSMDLKLASATGIPTPLEAHRQFLAMALRRHVFAKAVVTETTTDEELDRLAECIASQSRGVPLVLQPVAHPASHPPSPQRLLQMHARLAVSLDSVRIVPQVHKILGIR